MFKIASAVCFLYVGAHGTAYAACSSEGAMNKGSEVSEVLSSKIQTKMGDASNMMAEMGTIMASDTVTDQTCAKLDVLMLRARKL